MATKEIAFTELRQQFAAVLNDVEKSRRPVTITRRGKPAAVIISHDVYEQQFQKAKVRKKAWTLKGTIVAKPSADIERALKKIDREHIQAIERDKHKSREH
jgi:prevent-host-death family protein